MADMMAPPGGGLSQGGPPQGGGALENMKANRSVFNPMDAAGMVQDGSMSPEMTISEFFQAQYGLDVNTNTLMDLAQVAKKNAENNVPVLKARNMAQGQGGAPGMGQAPPPMPQEAAPQGGLGELVQGMR